jgi:hypothetical protein
MQIKDELYKLYTQLINKIALSGRDDKRFLLNDGSHNTLALDFKMNFGIPDRLLGH